MSTAKPILADTDVLIDVLRAHPLALELVRKHANNVLISVVVVAELYSGVKGSRELAVLDRLVNNSTILPIDAAVAIAAGEYRRRFWASHRLHLPDALIAATAHLAGLELKTLNVRHYPMFKNLKPAYLKH